MLEGTIDKLDLTNRTAILVDDEGNEITIRFTERTSVEVAEDETVGMMGGELEDLEDGTIVEVEVTEKNEDGSYYCNNIACIS